MFEKFNLAIELLKTNIKNKGKQKGLQSFFCQILGVSSYEEEIRELKERVNTLSYLLNESIDITSIPPTKNEDLRIMQQCDALLLVLFDKICKKHNLVYWLTYGTLLGAVRHKGFIPWDDDMDVAMPREHFNRLKEILVLEFESKGFTISDFDKPGYVIGFGYKHVNTGTWLDVFPIDIYSSSQKLDDLREVLDVKIDEYRSFYNKEKENHDISFFEVERRKRFMIDGDYEFVYHGIEFGYGTNEHLLYEINDIYPLKSLMFEGHCFPVPNNYDKYLRCIFGNYMLFPQTGILIHDEGRGPLHTWAKKKGVVMTDVKDSLVKIIDSYC